MKAKRALLVILDGWGHGQKPSSSAITQANTPFVDSLYKKYPNTELVTYGEDVGLPEGQMGNSEVGHLNIGAGRVVYQELARINKAIRERTLHTNEPLLAGIERVKASGKAFHLFGLLSDGGVHSHINHVKALCDITQEHGLKEVYIHVFLDGRDTDPKSGLGFLKELTDHIKGTTVKIATVIGRYYAMDRDKRWERVKLAYDAIVNGVGFASFDPVSSVQSAYNEGETDEFIKPIICVDRGGTPVGMLDDGDTALCFNFRTDRPREISEVLTQVDMPEYDMYKKNIDYLTMTRYDDTYQGVSVLFTKDDISLTLGEVLSNAGKTQTRIAETEKYPHVTFFFNGGREEPFPGERRILIPSPKVATYDLQPEMGAVEITDAIIADIEQNQPDFICLNYANADMVGHTGDFQAAIKAVETVDTCLNRLIDTALAHEYEALVIADHGNSDYMINEDGTPNTAHTTNPVPCFYLSKETSGVTLSNGKLADVAPTILSLLGVEIPEQMDGNILVN